MGVGFAACIGVLDVSLRLELLPPVMMEVRLDKPMRLDLRDGKRGVGAWEYVERLLVEVLGWRMGSVSGLKTEFALGGIYEDVLAADNRLEAGYKVKGGGR